MNGFFPSATDHIAATSIPYRTFKMDEAIPFAQYTDRHLQGRGIPAMSFQLRRKFMEGLDELFGNAVIHSRSEAGVFCCGQSYPKNQKLDFSVVDAGIGFRENIWRVLGRRYPPEIAIDWALRDRSTTRVGDVPGGLGLKIIKEFVQMNGGRFIIVSDRGYWCLSEGRIEMHRMKYPFPGTAVTLEINTADQASYYLTNEIDPANIF